MTDQGSLDSARIAALIDGRLGANDAAELRAQLVASDDMTIAALADAAAIAAELHAASPAVDASGVPVQSIARPSRWFRPALVAAAVVAVIGTATLLRNRREGSVNIADPQTLAMALDARAQVLRPAWSATRGSGGDVSARGRAIRTGALLLDLSLASRRRDSSTVDPRASLAALLQGVTGGASIGRELAGQVLDDTRRAELSDQAMRLTGARLAQCGAWLEGARLAFASGDTSFVRRYPLDAVANALRSEGALDVTQQHSLTVLSEALRSEAPVKIAQAQIAIDDLLRSLGR